MSEAMETRAWQAMVWGRRAVLDGFVPPDAFVEALFAYLSEEGDDSFEEDAAQCSSLGELFELRGMLTSFQRSALEKKLAPLLATAGSDQAASPSGTGALGPSVDERYTIGEILQQGGAGRIYRADDKVIGRQVALKCLINPDSEAARRRFVNEYRITGGLDHPNIISVHDAFVSQALGPFYVMRLLDGETLREVFRRAHAQGTPGRTALLRIFLDICAAVAYAHSRGVIHRDLKPGNVMVGELGEVQVMDWGIALRLDHSNLPTPPLDTAAELESLFEAGAILGTPGYMAPEQARGELQIDGRADIFALGCILYELLTHRFPFKGNDLESYLAALDEGEPPLPSSIDPSIGQELDEIVMRSLALAPDDRLATVREMSAAISIFLDGSRTQQLRQKRALSKVAEGIQARARLQQHEAQAQRILGELRGEQARIRPYDPVEKKRPLWDKELEIERLEKDVMVRLGEAISAFTQALALDPDSHEAHSQLADLYYERMRNAERHRDIGGIAYNESMLQRHNDDGRYDRFLEDQGSVLLRSDPPGAEVTLYALREKDRILTPDSGTSLGETPLGPVVLPTGSYLAIFEMGGFVSTHVPIWIQREQRHVARGRLYQEGDIPEGFTYIPQGRFLMGGDPFTASAGRVSEPYLPDVFVATLPTTIEAYLHFLNDIKETTPEGGQAHGPRRSPDGGFYLERDDEGDWVLPGIDEDGDSWDPEWPVFAISWHDATAYASWFSEHHGVACRLPQSNELEKAARGVDGRYYPWGDKFDATFCKMGQSQPGPPKPEAVGVYPQDVSVYGVRDLAGGIREWCGDEVDAPDGAIAFGGNWSGSELTSRAAHRWFLQKGHVASGLGLRLAMDAPAMPYHQGFGEEEPDETTPISLPRLPELPRLPVTPSIQERLSAPALWDAMTQGDDEKVLTQLAVAATDAGAEWALILASDDDLPLATAGDAPDSIPRSLLHPHLEPATLDPQSAEEGPQISPFVAFSCGEPPEGYLVLSSEHPELPEDWEALSAAIAHVLGQRKEREQASKREDQALHAAESARKELTIVREALATVAPDTYLREAYPLIDGRSRPMLRLFRMLDRLIQSEVNVLIRGESGVGKERVARTIHQHGPAKDGPFVAVNCGAIPENLIESELFGHTKGAFTGAIRAQQGLFRQAHGGTLFLDEIAELSLEAQVKLLRALQNRAVRPVGDHTEYPFQARILAATHKDLKRCVEEGSFREDLYWRIVVVELEIPPLRERPEDIPLLISRFLSDWQKDVDVAEDAMALLQAYSWPGNIRELENEIRRALVIAEQQISTSQLSDKVRGSANSATRLQGKLRDIVAQVERDAIALALELSNHNKAQTARTLGLSKRGLQLKMQRYGLS